MPNTLSKYGHATSINERNATSVGTAVAATGVAAAPEIAATGIQIFDDWAIRFSEEKEEDDSGSIMADH